MTAPAFARTVDGGGVRIDQIVQWRRPTRDLPNVDLGDGERAIPVTVKGLNSRSTLFLGPFPDDATALDWIGAHLTPCAPYGREATR